MAVGMRAGNEDSESGSARLKAPDKVRHALAIAPLANLPPVIDLLPQSYPNHKTVSSDLVRR